MTTVTRGPSIRSRVTWAAVDKGFYVASRAGEFVGSVDTTVDRTFVALDERSTPIGRYHSLAEAKAAVAAVSKGVPTPSRPIVNASFVAATVAGGLTTTLMLVAASLPG
jgi:hypothetical protein